MFIGITSVKAKIMNVTKLVIKNFEISDDKTRLLKLKMLFYRAIDFELRHFEL
jgi:hypothetical protein